MFRNKKGQPLLLFKNNLIGRKETMPLIVANEGSLNSKVYIDLLDTDAFFSLVPTGKTKSYVTDGYDDDGKLRLFPSELYQSKNFIQQ